MKNGKEIGSDYLLALEAYLNGGGSLPTSIRDGTLNLKELCRLTGIPRSTFYQNPSVKDYIGEACAVRGITRWGDVVTAFDEVPETKTQLDEASRHSDKSKSRLERSVHKLEQQNAVLTAENSTLRAQNKELKLQMGREDMMIETGRRVPTPQAPR